MSTEKNLMDAFAGESQANRKYLAYAKKAEKEGHAGAAKMFRAAAAAETIHAHGELDAAGKVGSTEDNLKDAVGGETFEFEKMYPPYVEEAKAEGNDKAARIFQFALEAEKVHANLFDDVLSNLNSANEWDFYLCPVCGYVEKNGVPESCPICGAKGSMFQKID